MTKPTIGNNIRAARERRRLLQKDCATAIGVSQSTWCDWESGKTSPRYTRLPGIARLLRVPVARLVA